RNDLYQAWNKLHIIGRTYIASEGINAQLSVPEPHWEAFLQSLEIFSYTEKMFVNEGLTEGNDAFLKLDVKVRDKIVADGIEEDIFEVSEKGTHLDPLSFH